MSVTQAVGIGLGVLVLIAILSAVLTPFMVRRGLRTPAGLKLVNHVSEQVIDTLKRPLTIIVLDEVIDVMRTGHYTKNISDAIVENHDELKALVADKIHDSAGLGLIGKLPGYELIVGQASEATLNVLISMLADPRMDEFVSDLLRNNLQQIRESVHAKQNDRAGVFDRSDVKRARAR
jgi:hypothetical protein